MALLYDEVIRWFSDSKHRRYESDHNLLRTLQQAQVFDISPVIDLIPEWEAGRAMEISKRPPYETVWAEWQFADTAPLPYARMFDKVRPFEGMNDQKAHTHIWTIGCLIFRPRLSFLHAVREIMLATEKLKANEPLLAHVHDYYRADRVFASEHIYFAMFFRKLKRAEGGMVPNDLYNMLLDGGLHVFGLDADGLEVTTTATKLDGSAPRSAVEYFRELVGSGNIHYVVFHADDPFHQLNFPWPPWMAFTLLHCKNIEVERHDPPPKVVKKALRHGKVPPGVHYTLHVHVPSGLHVAGDGGPPAEGDGVRLHLCRGHFKHLTAARYKNPGWYWWPAHWRGDPAKGMVAKRYELDPQEHAHEISD